MNTITSPAGQPIVKLLYRDDTVVDQLEANQRPQHVAKPSYYSREIKRFPKDYRDRLTSERLQNIVSRHAKKPGFDRIHRALTDLLQLTEGINDGEVLLEVGAFLFFHGAQCMAEVPTGRKPEFAVRLASHEEIEADRARRL